MTDARIAIIREAMLMGYGLFMADHNIRELLSALDKIGKPLPAAQTITLDELTQKPQGSEDWVLDLIADANAHDEAHQPADGGTR
jgi:hypothetical protein